MIQDFFIIQRRKPDTFPAHAADYPVWSTCLRSLAFTSHAHRPLAPNDEVYANADAYQFLLEVVCGLKSPVLGETEVFGQFKVFAQEWLATEPRRAPLVQRLLNDAKAIRTQHLRHLGTQSYGGWVRKKLRGKRVHVLGAGHLAQEILPYLHKLKVNVVVHGRDTSKLKLPDVALLNLGEHGFDNGALIVAAPLRAEAIYRWLNGKTPTQIFDLRETSASDPLNLRSERFVLSDIFSEIEKTKNLLRPRLTQIQKEIAERSQRLASQSMLRPLGWDDLCA